MFRVPAGDILPAAEILRRLECREEVVVEQPREWPLVVDSDLSTTPGS
jgi:hypothetical protein